MRLSARGRTAPNRRRWALAAAAVALGYLGAGCGDDDGAECWNHVLEPGEVCDGTDFGGETCATLAGKPNGPLRCAADCQSIDTSRCHACGDGVVDGAEDCEGGDTAGETCASIGHAGGTLLCQADCYYDTSGCFDCDDGRCDVDRGEAASDCPADCGWGPPAVGDGFSCSLVPGAGPLCWGRGYGAAPVLLARGGDVVTLVAASDGLYGLTADGVLWIWPTGALIPREPPEARDVLAVAAHPPATGHRCLIDADQALWCWGQNDFGQIGDGSTDYADARVAVPGVGRVRAVAVGEAHTCAVTEAGEVLCWGAAGLGQLGIAPPATRCGPPGSERPCVTTPGAVPDLAGVVALAAGGAHTCAVTEAGEVLCWGADDAGQVGDGPDSDTCDPGVPCRTAPALLGGLADVRQVVAGSAHTCALAGETLYCWGDGSLGQLGLNASTSEAAPQAVTGVFPVSAVAAASGHTCASTSTGQLYCWGENADGQLGTGDTTPALMPAAVQDATFMASP